MMKLLKLDLGYSLEVEVAFLDFVNVGLNGLVIVLSLSFLVLAVHADYLLVEH